MKQYPILLLLLLLLSCDTSDNQEPLIGIEMSDLKIPDPEADTRARNGIIFQVYTDTAEYFFNKKKNLKSLIGDSIERIVYNEHGREVFHYSDTYKRFDVGRMFTVYNENGWALKCHEAGCSAATTTFTYDWHPEQRILYRFSHGGWNDSLTDTTMFLFDENARLNSIVFITGVDEPYATLYNYDTKGRLVSKYFIALSQILLGRCNVSEDPNAEYKKYYYTGNKIDSTEWTYYSYRRGHTKKIINKCYFDERGLPYLCNIQDMKNVLVNSYPDIRMHQHAWKKYSFLEKFKK